MRRNRLLLPWGLLAGLLVAIAVVEGLNIKPPSLLKKPRNHPTTAKTTPLTTTTTSTTTTTTEAPETTTELEHQDNETLAEANFTKSNLSGNPQIDYVFDPNLPRELPKGYNLSEYPFFERVPDNVKYDCDGKLDGFYANVKYKCQIYHHCLSGLTYDFLCANYTAFDQRTFTCQYVSEVDCANSPKWWFRNEPLYKGRITTTVKPTTTTAAPTTSTRRPAGGRRRRPFRRRRPQYDDDYYDDYDEEDYEDDVAGPGQRQRKRQRRPGSIAAAADAEVDDKPVKPSSSVYDRPRVLPKIRRPVPVNERGKYDYKSKGGAAPVNGGGEKRTPESAEKSTSPVAANPGTDADKPKRPADGPALEGEKPRESEVQSRPRPQKPRPQEDDDEYYDDEDYDQPVRKTPRKNQHEYYAPSGGDRDFGRRPAMSGAGRPLRRNRPGRRRPAPIEYDDDDYEDDRRPYRPSAPALDDRRRYNPKSRKRPYRDDYYDDEEYERPSYRDTKRPLSSRDSARDTVYDRPSSSSSRDSSRTPTRDTAYERPAPAARDPAYERPATPTRDSVYDRPAPSGRDSTYQRPAPAGRDPANERPVTPTRDSAYVRQPPATRDTAYERPVANSRDSAYEKTPPSSRGSAIERQSQASRGAEYEKEPPLTEDQEYSRPSVRETSYERLSGNKKRFQNPTTDSIRERPRPDRPGTRGTSDYDHVADPDSATSSRPVPSRNRYTDQDSDDPIPAARPAYISTTGRSSYRKRGPEEASTISGLRGIPRTTPKVTVTEPPALLDDEEYYDDDEEVEEELPQKPTGSGRTQTGSYRDPPVESRKPSATRDVNPEVGQEPRNTQGTESRAKGGEEVEESREGSYHPTEDRERSRPIVKDRERIVQVPPTGRGRLPTATDVRLRTRFGDDGNSETKTDGRVVVGKPTSTREQSRSNTNRATESILEQPPLKSTSSQANLRTKDESGDESVPQRPDFRTTGSAETTSDKYSNFRRKQTQEARKELPSREDRVVEIAEDVHIAPSSQGRSQATSEAHEDRSQVDIELESDTLHEGSLRQLDTGKFISEEPDAKEQVSPSVPIGQGFGNNQNAQNPAVDETVPTGRGASNGNVDTASETLDDTPHRNELPDINDPEYDVTLNEALQPTRPILLSTEGAVGKKSYRFRDVSIEPELTGPGSEKLPQTLLTSASHTHVSKAPFPVHAKDGGRYRRPGTSTTTRATPQYDDYDDLPIPTGKGGTTVTYSTTESVFRASQQQSPISLSSRGASGQQFPSGQGNGQYVQFPPSPTTGTLRQLEQELAKTLPRARVNPQPYRSPSQGTIREAEYYRGSIDPIALSLGYQVDYDQATKYRPRRKLVWRDRFHDFYNLY